MRILMLVLLCLFASASMALEVPVLTNYVTDMADKLSASEEAGLNSTLEAYHDSTHCQMCILVIESLEGEDLEDFSMRVVEKTKLGHQGDDKGLLLLWSAVDRKLRIEVGYGLEEVIPDAVANRAIAKIGPYLAKEKYAEGLTAGMQYLMQAASGHASDESGDSGGLAGKTGFLVLLIIIGVVVIIIIIVAIGSSGGFYGGVGGSSGTFTGGFGGSGGGSGGGGSFGGFGGGFGGGGASGGY
jgi:uncharacterized protein